MVSTKGMVKGALEISLRRQSRPVACAAIHCTDETREGNPMTETTQDRTPTQDPAEDGAFFPSPYSLTQYTAPTTDFDGLATEEQYRGGRWKVLVIAAHERYMRMRNGTFFSTGNHPVETLLPLHHMAQAGYGIDVATLTGGPGKLEWWAYPSQDQAVASTWEAAQESFKTPRALADVIADGLDDYAAIFIPGGHGAMTGLPDSRELRSALDFFMEQDRLIITLCHGPAALLAAGIDREKNPFAGRRITAFPDSPGPGGEHRDRLPPRADAVEPGRAAHRRRFRDRQRRHVRSDHPRRQSADRRQPSGREPARQGVRARAAGVVRRLSRPLESAHHRSSCTEPAPEPLPERARP